jgi:hypothetical protein
LHLHAVEESNHAVMADLHPFGEVGDARPL